MLGHQQTFYSYEDRASTGDSLALRHTVQPAPQARGLYIVESRGRETSCVQNTVKRTGWRSRVSPPFPFFNTNPTTKINTNPAVPSKQKEARDCWLAFYTNYTTRALLFNRPHGVTDTARYRHIYNTHQPQPFNQPLNP